MKIIWSGLIVCGLFFSPALLAEIQLLRKTKDRSPTSKASESIKSTDKSNSKANDIKLKLYPAKKRAIASNHRAITR